MIDLIATILVVIGSFALLALLIFIYRKVRTAQKQLEFEIVEKTEQLEKANKELDSFTYAVSHDLRAPLRAVSGYTTMLIEDHASMLNGEGKRLLTQVEYNANRMSVLIENLTTFSRLGRGEVRMREVNMESLIRDILNAIPKSNANILVGKLNPVVGDKTMMQHLMVNLLSNAIKYSSKKEHPEINISSVVEDGTTTYSIADNGVGFDMQYATRLFGVFQRFHSTEDFEGAGVGLAMVQKIIARHGGKVWAQSKVNEGATFFFSLPAKVSEQESTNQKPW